MAEMEGNSRDFDMAIEATPTTAGTWSIAPDQHFNGWDVIPVQIESPEGDRVIAMVLGSQNIPEPLANAKVIAAAPALVAALEAVEWVAGFCPSCGASENRKNFPDTPTHEDGVYNDAVPDCQLSTALAAAKA